MPAIVDKSCGFQTFAFRAEIRIKDTRSKSCEECYRSCGELGQAGFQQVKDYLYSFAGSVFVKVVPS